MHVKIGGQEAQAQEIERRGSMKGRRLGIDQERCAEAVGRFIRRPAMLPAWPPGN